MVLAKVSASWPMDHTLGFQYGLLTKQGRLGHGRRGPTDSMASPTGSFIYVKIYIYISRIILPVVV